MRSLIIALFILVLVKAVSSQVLSIPFGSSIINDGVVNSNEWADADTSFIQLSAAYTSTVLYKHDGQQLHIAFVGNLQTPFFYFPEVNIDANYDQAQSFQLDDWWFHVSATDCEFQGTYGNYNNCQVVRPNWTANPNFNSTGPLVNRVELSIPLQTLGLQSSDTIGLLFFLNNFQSFRYHLSTANHLNPSTWATAVLEPIASSLYRVSSSDKLQIWPNPTSDLIHIRLDETWSYFQLRIVDLHGKVLYEESEPKSKIEIDLSKQSAGLYFLELLNGEQMIRKKIVLK